MSQDENTTAKSAPIRVWVHCEPTTAAVQKLSHDLKQHGYRMEVENKQFRIPSRPRLPAMLWSLKVENLPYKVVGVISASIDYGTSRISIEYLPEVLNYEQLRKAVMSWGTEH
jgi:hypothetical protein